VLISTRDEARAYYKAQLARAHAIIVRDCPITIVFEKDATHVYSTEIEDPLSIKPEERVVRYLSKRKTEVRLFNLDRAKLMDEILRAITRCTVSASGGTYNGREKILLYGPRLECGRYMCVVLRPGPGEAFTCVSAYPVEEEQWRKAKDPKRTRPTRFPPI
jgi:hypothetical protein